MYSRITNLMESVDYIWVVYLDCTYEQTSQRYSKDA
jgi:hypothetical protein